MNRSTRPPRHGHLWWKSAVFYCADVETFYDWTGNGTGDIRGMAERIE